jgi:hypothetical protein
MSRASRLERLEAAVSCTSEERAQAAAIAVALPLRTHY